jgi:sarcosine oxidase
VGISSSEVCVIGAGIVGLATAATLCDEGVDVACYEAAQPGQGQSAGRTRQFRHLHADPGLIELAVRARVGWLDWEERYGRTLLGSEGALRAGGEPSELDALRAAGVPAERLDAHGARELFPIAALASGPLLWDPLAGAIRGADVVAALAARVGTALRRAAVRSISIRAGGASVELETSAGVHRCARCVVCAGAGTDRLVRRLGLDVRQERQAHLRLSFRTRAAPPRPLPCFSDRRGSEPEHVYALSDLGDRYAVGLAAVTTYPAVADLAGEVPSGVNLASQRERIISYVRQALPGLDPEPVDEVLRLTTTLPDRPEDGFEIWREGPVVALAGPNLFKFAPVIGEQLARVATDDAISSTEDATSPTDNASRVSGPTGPASPALRQPRGDGAPRQPAPAQAQNPVPPAASRARTSP